MKFNKNVFVCTFTLISSFIGAGFVSGAEIVLFFINFNVFSIHFAVFSLIIFASILFFLLNINYSQTIKTSSVFSIIQIIIYLGFSSVMLSGISEINNILLNTKIPILTIIFSLLLYILIKQEIKVWSKVSSLLCVFMIVIILIVCIYNNKNFALNPIPKITIMSHLNPILYFSMNLLIILPLTKTLGLSLKTKKQKQFVTIFSTLIICILITLILLTIESNNQYSMPLLYYASNISTVFYYIYLITITISIFTTLLSCFYALTEYSFKFIKNKTLNNMFCLLLCLCISMLGFTTIFQYIYPLIGILGLFIIPIFVYQESKNKLITSIDKIKH